MMAERTTHTPGPWEVSRTDEDIERKVGVTVYVGEDDGAGRFAAVRGIDLAEDAANARLIAAAPDMLAALQELGEIVHVDAARCYEITQAAIAKATGE